MRDGVQVEVCGQYRFFLAAGFGDFGAGVVGDEGGAVEGDGGALGAPFGADAVGGD